MRCLVGMMSALPGNPDENGSVFFFVHRMLNSVFLPA